MVLCNEQAIEGLAKIIITETQPLDEIDKMFPLSIQDKDTMWLVTGAPHDNLILNLRYNIVYLYIKKDNCEVIALGCEGRMMLDAQREKEIRNQFGDAEYESVFGMPKSFKVNSTLLQLTQINGGIISSSASAVGFARVILNANMPDSPWLQTELKAFDITGVWHIQASILSGKSRVKRDILIFNKSNAKVLVFDP